MDSLSPKERSKVMGLVRSQNTKPELRVRRILHALGYRYRLHGKGLPGKPDIVFRKYKVVVFVHGCFWHRHKQESGGLVDKGSERKPVIRTYGFSRGPGGRGLVLELLPGFHKMGDSSARE